MKAIRCAGFALVALAAFLLLANPSHADSGSVRAEGLNEVGDLVGAYSVVGGGAALLDRIGEVSANVSTVVITLDPSRSTPN